MSTKRPSELAALQSIFVRYATEVISDHYASLLVKPVIKEAGYAAAEKIGHYADSSDLYDSDRGFMAIELLNLLPSHESLQAKEGFPETRYQLWRAIIFALMRGSSNTPQFAQALLKKISLSEQERVRLRDALKDGFESAAEIEVRQSLFTALRQTRAKSEPLVVRAFLRTIIQKVDDDKILELVLAIQWK